jgi:hypothetical protein
MVDTTIVLIKSKNIQKDVEKQWGGNPRANDVNSWWVFHILVDRRLFDGNVTKRRKHLRE